jgi:cytoskeletal protein RodZ
MLSVGTIFSRERQRRGFTLKQVEKHTRIREKFLEAIEKNDWSLFSSKIYITGLIKNYSKFLDLDEEKMAAYFRRDYERREEVKFKKRVESKYFKSETKRLIFIGISVVVLLFAGYFAYQLKNYFAPPSIKIISPQNTDIRNTDRITIRGKTEPDANIVIFEERVYQDKNGDFVYDFPLKKGANRLVIDVTGANGKKTTIQKTFTLH